MYYIPFYLILVRVGIKSYHRQRGRGVFANMLNYATCSPSPQSMIILSLLFAFG